MIETLALILAISGLLAGLCAAGAVVGLVSAAVWHFLPSCAFSRWLKAEMFMEEELSFKDEQQDWIAKRMNR